MGEEKGKIDSMYNRQVPKQKRLLQSPESILENRLLKNGWSAQPKIWTLREYKQSPPSRKQRINDDLLTRLPRLQIVVLTVTHICRAFLRLKTKPLHRSKI